MHSASEGGVEIGVLDETTMEGKTRWRDLNFLELRWGCGFQPFGAVAGKRNSASELNVITTCRFLRSKGASTAMGVAFGYASDLPGCISYYDIYAKH
jgi:hypothetical protein